MWYSCAGPDGETCDISNIEEVLRDNGSAGRDDLLGGVHGRIDAVGVELNRELRRSGLHARTALG